MIRLFSVLIILSLFVNACSSDKPALPSDVEIVPVHLQHAGQELTSFLEKIEVLPLETNDSSLIDIGRKVLYDEQMNVYAIYNKKQIVSIFDGNGHFIGSSKKAMGAGPEEYAMAVDVNFNPYLQGVDLLNPFGVVYTYNLNFDLIDRKVIQPEFVFDALMALSEREYIFSIPNIWVNQEVSFADFEEGGQQQAFYSGSISPNNSLSKTWFYQDGNDYYFVPTGVNYYLYKIDKEQKKLIPLIYLDFGDDALLENDLPGAGAGKRTKREYSNQRDKEREYLADAMKERAQYLREKGFIIPSIKLFNKMYVYIYLMKGTQLYGTYIYDRKHKRACLIKNDKSCPILPCFCVTDNVLLAICDAYYAKDYVVPQLMSPSEIEKIRNLKDDDNPVIFKYYLRK